LDNPYIPKNIFYKFQTKLLTMFGISDNNKVSAVDIPILTAKKRLRARLTTKTLNPIPVIPRMGERS
jgi:hypothetical protein